jgi:deazaflavin-dependent oxidoreductase (nitroreductase family)
VALVSKDSVFRSVNGLHRSIFKASKGRLLGRVAGMPVLMLTTTGRKSGEPRTTMLTVPIQEGDSLIVVASKGGDQRNPAWFLNLRDNAEVEVLMKGRRQKMTARIATTEQKLQLWPKVTAAYKGYAGYQKKTDRDIPLVILSA